MSLITLLENESVTVWYHKDKRIVHHQFHKFMYGDLFKEALMTGADALEKYGAQKWLSDDRKNSALLKEDLEWARTVWFSRVAKAGWKYWAVVMPENVVGKMTMESETKINENKGVTTKLFIEPDEAMVWLESL